MMGHFHYGVTVSLVVWFFCLLLLPGLFLVLCFVGFLFRYHPVVDSGLRNGPRSTFDSQCGMLTHALSNSFISIHIV